ncbi:MAG: PrsW family intramembrane metalloprotease [Planctomycetales bacterium]|nr:PrsW family intramembrane metalloprotease [Planctomycetales bacterium]
MATLANIMNRRSYLKVKTRDPAFLWRMVLWIIAAGIVLGYVAQYFWQPQPQWELRPATPNSGWQQLEELAEQGLWWEAWMGIPAEVYAGFAHRGPLALAVFAGCCWLAFLLQALQIKHLRDWRLWATMVAILLGVLSVWPTLFFILKQEVGWGLVETNELIGGLRYNVLGVGLREEFAKLCCLLPLMPLLLRQRNELAVLLVSAAIGLGFAIEENVSYFRRSQGAATMGRFLTANPFHMALTGLVGLAVYRALRYPQQCGPQAGAIFGLMVFAHGFYDAALSIPALADYSLAGTIVFALVVYQFFHELRTLRTTGGDTVSLSANFLCGVSLLTSVTFVYLSATLGCAAAFDSLATGVLGLAVMVYLFLREMPDTMVTV